MTTRDDKLLTAYSDELTRFLRYVGMSPKRGEVLTLTKDGVSRQFVFLKDAADPQGYWAVLTPSV